MKYIKWRLRPSRFLALTGYTIEEFDHLLPYFEDSHNIYFNKYHLNGKNRSPSRKFVLYSNSPLPEIGERLAFILSYLKLNPNQEQHADYFDIEQRQCCEFVHSFKKILDMALKELDVLPASTQDGLERKLNELPQTERVLLHDGTEREIPRPEIDEVQKENFSGKKKKHTVKNGLVTTMLCCVLFVSQTVPGSVHDKKIADNHYKIPRNFELWQDTGYQGYKPEGVTVVQPKKKPKGKDLTKEQKDENKRISSIRVRVEHAIGSVKRYKIVRNECRLRKDKFVYSVLKTACGLHNFRLRFRPFKYQDPTVTKST